MAEPTLRERIYQFAPPLAVTALLIAAWHFSVVWFDVPAYLVPLPEAVLRALNTGLLGGLLWPDIWATLSALLFGYVTGCALALALATLVSESRMLERAFYPIIVAIQSVPKVALAPLITVWFGFELESKVVMVALICFFPTFVNTVIGLKSCNPNLVDLYRAFGASRMQILVGVKWPSALATVFAGLEISVVLALLGAVVAEFISSRAGLGHRIQASTVDLNVAVMFACVIILAVMGVVLTHLVRLVRRRVAFWERAAAPSINTWASSKP